MGLGDAMKKFFGTSTDATPADERQLAGGSEDALGASLQKYAFGELDDDGKTRLAQFAAQYRSTPDFRPTEGRIYFKKS
jgi:hypothetical protein